MRIVKKWLALSWYDRLNFMSEIYYLLRTMVWYRIFFAKIGRRSIIRAPLFISNPQCISIGANVSIRQGARLEIIKDSREHRPVLEIGHDTNIEQNVHIVCHWRIIIGAGVSITGNCAITDTIHPYEQDIPLKIGNRLSKDEAFVEIGDGAFIGYGAIIMPNVKIGKEAVIGAHSVVTHDVPPYSVVCGNPAKIVKGYR